MKKKQLLLRPRRLLGLGLALAVLPVCVSCVTDQGRAPGTMLTEVWTQPGWPPENLAAPAQFKLTPREAYALVAQAKRLPLKHQWFCFRDEQRYYIADAFGRSIQAKTALKHGIRVDGQTGMLGSP